MGLLQRKQSVPPGAFRSHWRDVHAPIAARLPGLRRYHQNHVVDTGQRGIDYPRGPIKLDGFSELWFDDQQAMERAIASDAIGPLAADESRFLDDIHVIAAEQHVVIPTPAGKA